MSAPGLEKLILPEDVKRVVIAADNDVNGRGQAAANIARARWSAEGRHVRVRMPTKPGDDFNDLLLSKIARGALA